MHLGDVSLLYGLGLGTLFGLALGYLLWGQRD